MNCDFNKTEPQSPYSCPVGREQGSSEGKADGRKYTIERATLDIPIPNHPPSEEIRHTHISAKKRTMPEIYGEKINNKELQRTIKEIKKHFVYPMDLFNHLSQIDLNTQKPNPYAIFFSFPGQSSRHFYICFKNNGDFIESKFSLLDDGGIESLTKGDPGEHIEYYETFQAFIQDIGVIS